MSWLLTLLPAVWSAPPPQPAPIPVTAEEAAQLAARELVVRQLDDGWVIGILHVDAPPPVVLDAVLDLEARQHEVAAIQSTEVYLQEPAKLGVRWTVGALGLSSIFHIVYESDRDNGWGVYYLDETRPNDIAVSQGSYQAYACDSGDGSRLVYRAYSESSAPEWVRQRMLASSLAEQIGGIRSRAEAAAR